MRTHSKFHKFYDAFEFRFKFKCKNTTIFRKSQEINKKKTSHHLQRLL